MSRKCLAAIRETLILSAMLLAALWSLAPVQGANIPLLPSSPTFNEPSQIVATLNTLINSINSNGPGLMGSSPVQATTTGTTIQTLGTVTIPASLLATPGQTVRTRCVGTGTVTGTNTLTIQVGNATAFAVAGAATTAGIFIAEAVVMKTGASTQQIEQDGQFNTTFSTPTVQSGTLTDTAPINITCSGTSTTTGNFTLNQMVAEQIK